jgi:type IX secretion system PorP/SprF family membrane protein
MANPKLIPFIFLCFVNVSLAQQETYLTHAAFNRMQFNPAFAGNKAQYELSSFHHRQWVGYLDQTGKFRTQDNQPIDLNFPVNVAPVTSGFSFSAPIAFCKSGDKKEIGGYGISLLQDNIGYENNTALKVALAYSVRINATSSLRLGFDFNYLTKRINAALLRAHQNPDPKIPAGNRPGDSRLLLGSGVLYQNVKWNQFFAGLSVSGINRPAFQYYNSQNAAVFVNTATHVYFFTGAAFRTRQANWMLYPTLSTRSVNDGHGWVLPQFEIQCISEYRKKIAIGGGTRGQANGADAFSFLLGFYPSGLNFRSNGRLRIGYSYDVTVQNLRQSSRNTHELQVNYTFQRGCQRRCILPSVIRHPRDLEFNNRDWE